MNVVKKGNGTPTHLAAGAALGYVFQFQVALVKLLRYALAQEEASASLEVLDDISLDHRPGRPPELIQVHQASGSRKLTDRSAKLWRTLAIWVSQWQEAEIGESPTLTLLSTQTAQDNSGIAALTGTNRDVNHAQEQLESVAADPHGADATAADRRAFLQLGEGERRALLSAVTVIDGATPPVNVREELVQALMGTNETQYVESMADMIEGWWWGRIPAALASKQPIYSDELRTQIDEARRMHSAHALPIFELSSFDSSDLPEFDAETARFVRCLLAVDATQRRRSRAAEDYQLNSAHRSRWARRGLLGLGEIDRFESSLQGQWLISSERMLRRLEDQEDESAPARAGHDLWDEMEQANIPPLRRDATSPFIQRGSFHQLVDDEKVAWHPDEVRKILDVEDETQ